MVAEFPDVRLRRAGVSRAVLLAAGERWNAASAEEREGMLRAVQAATDADLRDGVLTRTVQASDLAPRPSGPVDTRPVVRPVADNHNALTLATSDATPAAPNSAAPGTAAAVYAGPVGSEVSDMQYVGTATGVSVTVPLDSSAQTVTEDYSDALDTVASARAYVREHPDRARALLDAERGGRNRASLVAHLEQVVERTADA